jgi:hypothetical protein
MIRCLTGCGRGGVHQEKGMFAVRCRGRRVGHDSPAQRIVTDPELDAPVSVKLDIDVYLLEGVYAWPSKPLTCLFFASTTK